MDAAKQHKDSIAARLPGLARQLLSRPAFEIDAWRMVALTGGATSGGVYRLSIEGHDDAGRADGTLVLKITGIPDPVLAGPADWQREIHFYRSDLPSTFPAGLRAPRCYGVDDQADGSVWLWLEDSARCARPLVAAGLRPRGAGARAFQWRIPVRPAHASAHLA